MNKYTRKTKGNGFTLLEMLVVVVVIAVLAAIAIPVFSGQIEKTRLATDEANLRTAESLAVADMMLNQRDATSDTTISIYVDSGDDAETEKTLPENTAVYYFEPDASEAGIKIALDVNNDLAASGSLKSVYNDSLSLIVCVNRNGEIVAAGWK